MLRKHYLTPCEAHTKKTESHYEMQVDINKRHQESVAFPKLKHRICTDLIREHKKVIPF